MFTVGVDIGGTNTDAVLVSPEKTIVAGVKKPTTQEIDEGFGKAIAHLLETVEPQAITGVFVGTTHATNALLQREDLYRVGLIRIAGHAPETIPPCFGWPDDLKQAMFAGSVAIGGGFECDGTPITPFCLEEAKRAVQTLIAQGAESLAIVGVFSPLYPEQERAIQAIAPCPVSLSHEIGGVGIIERENSTLLNAALKKPLAKGFRRLKTRLEALGVAAQIFLTQNNGTILPLEKALEYPILTISAGPTNSFIGGAKLSGLKNAVIVDIGGTSTDVGIVHEGFPRRSLECSNIGGVALNFPMPDVLSVAIGGGSYISIVPPAIGPRSCGKNIVQEAICFGGASLTLTDLAVACDPKLIAGAMPVECPYAAEILQLGAKRIEALVEKIAGKETNLPVIVVGGGAALFRAFLDPTRYIIPENAGVANALGAALSEIAYTIDKVASLADREKTLQEMTQQCIDGAIREGASAATTRIVDLQTIPYHYIPGHLARVIVTASGEQDQRTMRS